jgi:outer membrane translocation and assembly module TamA
MLAQGLFQSAYYTVTCVGEQVDLHLYTQIGKFRLLRFGVGASTEELPFADVWYRNAKLDARASSYTASAHASPILQSLDFSSELYVVPGSRLFYFGPRLRFERRKERAYTLDKTTTGGDLGRAWDTQDLRIQGRAGPTLNYENTAAGAGPKEAKYVSWEAQLSVTSHAYEAFSRDQYEGWTTELNYHGQRDRVGSSVNADRYDLNFKHLWNLGAYSPPLFILASRVDLTLVDSKADDRDSLPIDYRVFYGGDQNQRGFSRESLNNGGHGYLTALGLGLELRLIEQLPYHLQPFLLWDGTRLGAGRYSFDSPKFMSTGVGIRWPSPFGTLRGTVARGQIGDGNRVSAAYQQEWVYFVSFGQEF